MNNFATSDFKRRQLYTWRSCEFTGVARWGTYPLAFQFLNVLTFRSFHSRTKWHSTSCGCLSTKI